MKIDITEKQLREIIDSDSRLRQRMQQYERFSGELERVKGQYAASKKPEVLAEGVRVLAQNQENHSFVHYVVFLGDDYCKAGDMEAGAACMQAVLAHFPYVFSFETVCLRMAQYHIEKGETETGIGYLVKLCTEVHNYKSRISVSELTEVWEKYRPLLVEHRPDLAEEVMAQPPVFYSAPQPLAPDKCSKQIGEILDQEQTDLLSNLSAHLGEMTANGECLNCLNKWERVFYYADEVCMEVNSGGWEGYLYYHGTHFAKACQAFEQIGAEQMVRLAEQVRGKFPRGKVPKSEEAIQNAMDRLEEQGVDFEDEDECYYSSAERELLDRLAAYVRENRKRFR